MKAVVLVAMIQMGERLCTESRRGGEQALQEAGTERARTAPATPSYAQSALQAPHVAAPRAVLQKLRSTPSRQGSASCQAAGWPFVSRLPHRCTLFPRARRIGNPAGPEQRWLTRSLASVRRTVKDPHPPRWNFQWVDPGTAVEQIPNARRFGQHAILKKEITPFFSSTLLLITVKSRKAITNQVSVYQPNN